MNNITDQHGVYIIEVSPSHQLSRVAVVDPPIGLDGVAYYSIEQLYQSCCLAQHKHFEAPAKLWSEHEAALKEPHLIRGIVEGYFTSRNSELSAAWVLSTREIMKTVIIVAVTASETSFSRLLKELWRERGRNVRFIETSSSKVERMWGSGIKSGQLGYHGYDVDNLAGLNMYGELLGEVYVGFFGASDTLFSDFPPIQRLLSRVCLPRAVYRKTAVVISDSNFKYVKAVDGGSVWCQTGLTCGQMAGHLKAKFANLQNFKFVIFLFGTNDAKLMVGPTQWLESWAPMRDMVGYLAGHPAVQVIFNTPIGVPRNLNAFLYATWFKSQVRADFPDALNFHVLDWATPGGYNVFVNGNGSANTRFLDRDCKHPNLGATRMMFRTMQETFEATSALKFVRLTTNSKPYQLPPISSFELLE